MKGKKTPGSGRVKNTPNKRTKEMVELCEEIEEKHSCCSPVETLYLLMRDSDVEDIRLRAANSLLPFLYPKRKTQEISMDGDGSGEMIIRWAGEDAPFPSELE